MMRVFSWSVRLCLGVLLGIAVWHFIPSGRGRPPERSHARNPAVGEFRNPQKIVEVRVALDGNTIIRRNGGLEKRGDDGLAWGPVSLRGQAHLPPLAVYQMSPTPDGDILAFGVVEDAEHTSAIYRVSGEDGAVSMEGWYPNLAPVEIESTIDGRVFVLAIETRRLNRLLGGVERMESPLEFELLHEIGRGEIIRSGLPQTIPVSNQSELLRRIEDIEELRLAAAPNGELYLFHPRRGIVSHVDRDGGGITGANTLAFAGFPSQVRFSNLEFITPDEVVYSLYELDEQGFVTGCQSHQADLSSGTSTVLHRHQGPQDAIWETHYDPAHDQLRLIDTLGAGREAMQAIPRRPAPSAAPRRIE